MWEAAKAGKTDEQEMTRIIRTPAVIITILRETKNIFHSISPRSLCSIELILFIR